MPHRSIESDLVCDGRTYLTGAGSSFHLLSTIVRLKFCQSLNKQRSTQMNKLNMPNSDPKYK